MLLIEEYEMDLLLPAKEIKHRLFLGRRRFDAAHDHVLRRYALHRRYEFRMDRYFVRVADVEMPEASTFLVSHLRFDSRELGAGHHDAPRRLFMIWFGGEELSAARKHALEVNLSLNAALDVTLVTEENLGEFVVPSHPVHAAWKNLSAVHKSDYFRAYLMHYWGGAYCDIKVLNKPWGPMLDTLNSSAEIWAVGPSELSRFNATSTGGRLGRDVKRNFGQLLCQAAFSCKPQTPLTSEWLAEVERRLAYFEDLLEGAPATSPRGGPGYPVPWNALNGQVIAPLALKYRSKIEVDQAMRYDYPEGGYR